MPESVKLIECPRDAWQGLRGLIPTQVKVEYLRLLIEAGFTHIDAVSFVSPKAVPQMADAEEVLRQLDSPANVEIIGIIVNERGAQRACATGAVHSLGFPYSVSPTFLHQNQNQSQEEALVDLRKIKRSADQGGMNIVAYISMAFGNPYGDPWSVAEVLKAVGMIESQGIEVISLADTVGLATPDQIRDLVSAVMRQYCRLEVGVHLHGRPDQSTSRILAAYDAGCRRFDAALGGLGGCPFAQDELVGNIPTERLIDALSTRGVEPPVQMPPERLLKMAEEIGARHSASQQSSTISRQYWRRTE